METPFASLVKTTRETKTNKPDVHQTHALTEDGPPLMEDVTFAQITNASEPEEEEPTSASNQAALVKRTLEFSQTAHAPHAQLGNNWELISTEFVKQSLAQLTTTLIQLQTHVTEEDAELDTRSWRTDNFRSAQTTNQAHSLLVLKMKTAMIADHVLVKPDGNVTETEHALNAQHTLFWELKDQMLTENATEEYAQLIPSSKQMVSVIPVQTAKY